MHRGRERRVRGSMMLEVVMASALAVIVLALLVSTQIQVLRNYQRTINHNTANRAAYNALREIREIAQQAVSVTVSGNTATILLPQRDANGRFRTPIQPDQTNPVFLQVNFTAGQLVIVQNGRGRTLLTNLVNTTPQGAPYTPFSVQQVALGVVAFHVRLSVREGQNAQAQRVWFEECILLRNATQN
jgi:Tfp pilus assembly protein PilW